MQRLTCSSTWHALLTAVHQDDVRYHHGSPSPSLGFTWSGDTGEQMFQETRHALHELWAANLIDIDTHRLFTQGGHRVHTTMRGYRLWCEWQRESNTDHQAPAEPGEQHHRALQVHGLAFAHR